MLLSFIGFILALIFSSIIGSLFLVLHPKWKLTLPNFVFFVLGSFFWVIIFSLIYSKIFADENNTLKSTSAVIWYLLLLIVTFISGGIFTIYLGRRIFNVENRE
jgi:hypothetical protein